ncbi:Rv3235 family protein [Blastococcus sp. PRF04-17]|uniref:Rv3235 family protein n=1 Tax=Blastococcus sp. PRF04-17 TaxID=2933797 RepID=UPI001FF341C3|nr:Rv3235 family protein [Blastococcus sp. PRF04-17]UOY01262.1 Rv3235 family protein [Blastococcus sp. PRF04-17]
MSAPSPTTPAAAAAGPHALDLVVVPTPQPPLQDERIPVRLVRPGVASPRPAHRPGPRPRSGRPDQLDDFGPVLSGRADLPDAHLVARRLVTLTLEALAGRRPLSQLQPLTSPGVFAALSAGRRPRWCAHGMSPLIVGAVRVCEPVDGVAEVSAVARRAGRAHAVAARLEGVDGRWRCTALQIG